MRQRPHVAPLATRWPLWRLPVPLRVYILAVVAGWLGTTSGTLWATWTGPSESPVADGRPVVAAGVLLVCGALAIEATRKLAVAANQAWRDMLGVWTLPLILVLPPSLALLVPVPLQLLSHARLRRALPHRLVFSVAATGLACGAGSWIFHVLSPGPLGPAPGWVLAGAAAGAVRFALNLLLVGAAVKASDPSVRWRGRLLTPEGAAADTVELTAGLAVTVLCSVSPWLVTLAIPAVVFVVSRAALTVQLRALAATDHKTGLLSAGAWEREAALAVAHATRTRSPLAVLMLDLDDFKAVNDTAGHLGGDAVLRVIALELRTQLRPADLLGRFGGDEFAILLPATTAAAAYDVAERLRSHVAGLAVTAPAGHDGNAVRVTVSVGVAGLPPDRHVDVTELLAAADHALYAAKRAGRNRTSQS